MNLFHTIFLQNIIIMISALPKFKIGLPDYMEIPKINNVVINNKGGINNFKIQV